MTEMSVMRKEAQEALLDLFASITRLPVGLYMSSNGQMEALFSPGALANFEEHCRMIQAFPGGKARCHADQCNRAERALSSEVEGVMLCHAGLYNQAIPIQVHGETRAVLLYGEMQIDDEEHRARSLKAHERVTAALGLDVHQADQLRTSLLNAKKQSLDELELYRTKLPKVEQWFFRLMDEEDRTQGSVERVAHEIQTRLQAVIADSENLVNELDSLSTEDIHQRANRVLYGALALDTVVQNVGRFLGDYRFRRQAIAPLLVEAKQVYESEANRRGIDITIRLHHADAGASTVSFSKTHLQHAINNLLHNAIKYSFRSASGRRRFVLITGTPEQDYYVLTFENYGVGILQEEIDSDAIFEDGYQGKLTQGEYRTGSGLGLSFVKRIVDRHKGLIRVTSELMADHETPEGQPHHNKFYLHLPYNQPKEGQLDGKDDRLDRR